MSVVGLGPGTQAKGKRVGCEATKLLGFFPLVCLFLLLQHDLQVPLLFHSLLLGDLVLVITSNSHRSGAETKHFKNIYVY